MLVLAFALVLGALSPASAARRKAKFYASHHMGFTNIDIAGLVKRVAKSTRTTFLFDEELRGSITIVIKRKVTRIEALAMLEVALNLRGFAVVELESGVKKIVPVKSSIGEAQFLEGPRDQGERLIATLYTLEHSIPNQIIGALRELKGKSTVLVSVRETNSIIAAGPEGRVARLLKLIRSLDEIAKKELVIRTLRYRASDDAAVILESIFKKRMTQDKQAQIWTDSRTNSLIVRAPAPIIACAPRSVGTRASPWPS